MHFKFFWHLALILTILAALTAGSPAYAKSGIESLFNYFLGALANVAEEIIPAAPLSEEVEEQAKEEFVDPHEIQQVLRELKDLKRELNRFAKQLTKLPNSGDDINSISGLLEQVSNFQARINSGENLRDTIQEFRDAQMWDEANKFRAKIEIPKETKRWNKEIKRIEKLLKQKKTQNAASEFGLDLEETKNRIEEMKNGLVKVQEYYNSGDLESAIEELDTLRQDLQPWEVSNLLQRFQEITTKLKKVKDQEIKDQVRETLSEIVAGFNEGDYQFARELMDESFNDLMQLIYRAYPNVFGKKYNKEGTINTMEQLETKITERAEEKKIQKEEIKVKTPESTIQPEQPVPTESVPQPTSTTP